MLTHGQGQPRIETRPAGEQPLGVPAPAPEVRLVEALGTEILDPVPSTAPRGGSLARGPSAPQKRPKPRFQPGEKTRELARLGGLARAAKAREIKALHELGLRGALPENLAPFLADANEFARAEVERLARECGGGVCPQNAALLVQQAMLALAGSRSAYAEGNVVLGGKLGVEVRQNLLAARELTVLEAKTRQARAPRKSLSEELGS